MNAWIRRGLQVGIISAGLLVASTTGALADDGGDVVSKDNVGVGSGNQAHVPVQVPVSVCGNAIGILGDAVAFCEGGAHASAKHGKHGDVVSKDNVGVITGNQASIPVQVPIDISGNALGIGGDAVAGSKGGAHAHMN